MLDIFLIFDVDAELLKRQIVDTYRARHNVTLGQKWIDWLTYQGDLPPCEHYLASIAIRKPFGRAKHTFSSFDLVHSDICGLMSMKA